MSSDSVSLGIFCTFNFPYRGSVTPMLYNVNSFTTKLQQLKPLERRLGMRSLEVVVHDDMAVQLTLTLSAWAKCNSDTLCNSAPNTLSILQQFTCISA